ncbi:hypothetical protein Q5752_002094 [Cryptotrichosporon argae]
MMFLTFMFFFMSGGNAPMPVTVGPDGEIRPRVTELDVARKMVDEYKGWMNGTGNWTETSAPAIQPWTLLPERYRYPGHGAQFFPNITGFHRDAALASVNVTDRLTAAHNATHASDLRGDFDWSALATWDMNLKERAVAEGFDLSDPAFAPVDDFAGWHWVKGGATLSSLAHARIGIDADSVDYDFYGLHYIPNGTYGLVARPQGVRIDIREIPRLWPDHHNVTSRIVLGELEKERKVQEDSLLLSDVTPDATPRTTCPVYITLAAPPLPPQASLADIELYSAELRRPTGILASLPRPPQYWHGLGLGGAVVSDQCGVAFELSGGKGVGIDDFWRKSINYAAFATACQLLVLVLLVRQMESTRTPSSLAKVSLWTIVMMGISDSWVFSAHVVVGIMSDNKSSLPMLVPGFLSLCTAVVFGPRYAVLLHRIQAPERVSAAPPARLPATPTPTPGATAGTTSPPDTAAATANAAGDAGPNGVLAELFSSPFVRWLAAAVGLFVLFQVAFLPTVIPFFLAAIYSIWLPQIWRNARRGTSGALNWGFVVGTSAGRMGLPLYAFACPENVLFVKPSAWVWALATWQVVQISVLYAQERFGPAFFLPRSLAPPESYNYHPVLPAGDAESVAGGGPAGPETTCSICMEDVDTRPAPAAEAGASALLGLHGGKKAYALAPCHHLFHTKCLAQWLAIKTICPLCKRSLPPL